MIFHQLEKLNYKNSEWFLSDINVMYQNIKNKKIN